MKIFCLRCRKWFGRHSYDCLVEIHLEHIRAYKKIISSTVTPPRNNDSISKGIKKQ